MSGRREPLDSKTQATHCSTCGAWPATIRPRHGVAYCEECGQPKEPPKMSLPAGPAR